MANARTPARVTGPAFLEVIRQFREAIGDSRQIPSPSGRLPVLTVKRSNRRKMVAALYFLTLIAAGVYYAPRLTDYDTVPAELVGSWMTDDSRYRGRHLELTPDALILRTSITEGTQYSVRRVQRSPIPRGSAYIIGAHSERDGDYTVILEYYTAQNTIALGKPARILWYRAH